VVVDIDAPWKPKSVVLVILNEDYKLQMIEKPIVSRTCSPKMEPCVLPYGSPHDNGLRESENAAVALVLSWAVIGEYPTSHITLAPPRSLRRIHATQTLIFEHTFMTLQEVEVAESQRFRTNRNQNIYFPRRLAIYQTVSGTDPRLKSQPETRVHDLVNNAIGSRCRSPFSILAIRSYKRTQLPRTKVFETSPEQRLVASPLHLASSLFAISHKTPRSCSGQLAWGNCIAIDGDCGGMRAKLRKIVGGQKVSRCAVGLRGKSVAWAG